MKKTATALTTLLTLAAFAIPAFAHDEDAATQDTGHHQLTLQTGNPDGAAIVDNSVDAPDTSATGVKYISGGISEEGRDGFLARHQGEGFNTQLLFTGPQGNYLADVEVHITDHHGTEVLTTTTDGPILLATLPAGSYTVRATYDGVERTVHVNAGKGTAKAALRFPNGD